MARSRETILVFANPSPCLEGFGEEWNDSTRSEWMQLQWRLTNHTYTSCARLAIPSAPLVINHPPSSHFSAFTFFAIHRFRLPRRFINRLYHHHRPLYHYICDTQRIVPLSALFRLFPCIYRSFGIFCISIVQHGMEFTRLRIWIGAWEYTTHRSLSLHSGIGIGVNTAAFSFLGLGSGKGWTFSLWIGSGAKTPQVTGNALVLRNASWAGPNSSIF